MTFSIEKVEDRGWLRQFILDHWGAPGVIRKGALVRAGDLSGALCARSGGEVAGCVSWRDQGREREVVTLNAMTQWQGIGSALLERLVEQSKGQADRLWLVTTNDNVDALRFYQRRGWRLSAIWRDALKESRRLKPSIPAVGFYGIPLRDEIELEYPL